MATTYAGLGAGDAAPLLNGQWNPAGIDLTPEHYFVLTRVDGRTPLKQIVLISGFGEEKAVAILRKLKESGAIYFPGETPSQPRPAAPAAKPPAPAGPVVSPAPPAKVVPSMARAVPSTAKPVAAPPVARRAATAPVTPPTDPPGKPLGTADTLRPGAIPAGVMAGPYTTPKPPDPNIKINESLLDEECDLSPEQKRAVLIKQASLKNATLFDVLEVPTDADKRALKRAYFKISKDFHPDRFYGKNLGTYRERLDQIFALATKAFEHLDDDGRRAAYAATLSAGESFETAGKPVTVPPGQTPAARAVELFDMACQHQVTGDTQRALQEFAAAIRLDPQPRFLRRASEAALRAQELRSAEEYATKAAELDPRDAGTQRMLAKVHRAMGWLKDARSELERAKRLDPGNRYIAAELEEVMADLAKGKD